MKNIKSFDTIFELLQTPQLQRGTILLFPKSYNLKPDFVKELCNQIGECNFVGEESGNIIIETPLGREEEIGKKFVDRYPEFFTGYERDDLRLGNAYAAVEKLCDMIKEIPSYFEGTDKKRFVDKDSYNDYLDDIIKNIKRLKI